MYRPGDYVYPSDLPRRLLCRVERVDEAETNAGAFQILTLTPLEGPWCDWPGTPIVRLSEAVMRAEARDLWRGGTSDLTAR
jgi:hypothetical protein